MVSHALHNAANAQNAVYFAYLVSTKPLKTTHSNKWPHVKNLIKYFKGQYTVLKTMFLKT
jgi:hypothetical protein